MDPWWFCRGWIEDSFDLAQLAWIGKPLSFLYGELNMGRCVLLRIESISGHNLPASGQSCDAMLVGYHLSLIFPFVTFQQSHKDMCENWPCAPFAARFLFGCVSTNNTPFIVDVRLEKWGWDADRQRLIAMMRDLWISSFCAISVKYADITSVNYSVEFPKKVRKSTAWTSRLN
jgi:hypothetical protein